MSDHYKPSDRKDIESAVQWAIAGGKSLEIIGHGSKRLLGRPAQYDATSICPGWRASSSTNPRN